MPVTGHDNCYSKQNETGREQTKAQVVSGPGVMTMEGRVGVCFNCLHHFWILLKHRDHPHVKSTLNDLSEEQIPWLSLVVYMTCREWKGAP